LPRKSRRWTRAACKRSGLPSADCVLFLITLGQLELFERMFTNHLEHSEAGGARNLRYREQALVHQALYFRAFGELSVDGREDSRRR
jgi:hypothetical protein